MKSKSTWTGVEDQKIHKFSQQELSTYYVLDTRGMKMVQRCMKQDACLSVSASPLRRVLVPEYSGIFQHIHWDILIKIPCDFLLPKLTGSMQLIKFEHSFLFETLQTCSYLMGSTSQLSLKPPCSLFYLYMTEYFSTAPTIIENDQFLYLCICLVLSPFIFVFLELRMLLGT